MSYLSKCLVFFLILITLACSHLRQRRVVVVGLDGLTPQLLFPWVEEGDLPAFKSLMKTGSYGILNSTTPPSSAPAWTSCITGVGPGRHGIYGFIRLFGQAWDKSPSQGLSFNSSMSNEAKTIWEILGSIGKRNIAINVPLTSPPFEINGVMIAGFPHPEKAPLTYPEAFEAEISDYRADAYGIHLEEGKEEEFLSDVYDISSRREILSHKLFA